MKRLLLILALILALLLVSCESELHVGENGNWWDGDEDLGIVAQGPKGDQGEQGAQGEQGETGPAGPRGEDGQDGEKGDAGKDAEPLTVTSVIKTPISDRSCVYIISFSDGTYTTFTVTDGEDGKTPYIGENGNWWVDGKDTGVKAVVENMDRIGTDGLLFRTTVRGGVAGYEVYGYEGTETDIVIPNFIFNSPVVSIAQDALPTTITSVSISSNTQYLPCFEDYTNLTKFDFNSAPVSTLVGDAFYDCTKLSEITNYENLRTIGAYAFRNTALKEFDFSGIKEIGSYAFYGCFDAEERILTGPVPFIYIPANVTSIASDAFDDETMVYYAGDSIAFTSDFLYCNVRITDDGYYYIDNDLSAALLYYDGDEERIALPKKLDGKDVTEIAKYAFVGQARLERVEISSSVSKIGDYAFMGCKNLHSLFVPSSITACGELDFLPDDEFLDLGYEQTYVFFEDSTLSYADSIESDLGVKRYMLGVSPDDIVDDDDIVYIKKTLSYEVVSIKNNSSFVTIPGTYKGYKVACINKYALYDDTLTTAVKISDGVERIAKYAFYSSSNLKAVSVPDSVDIVNNYGFYSVSNCTVYIEHNTIPENWDSSWYSSIDEYILSSNFDISSDGTLLYEQISGKIYLVRYLPKINSNDVIFIPDAVDGKSVYGIRSACYEIPSGTYERYHFVVPSNITYMDAYAIECNSNNYCTLYLYHSSSSDIPSTWNSSWCYTSSSSYKTTLYRGEWELVNGVPTKK